MVEVCACGLADGCGKINSVNILFPFRVLHLEKKKEVVAAAGQTKELRAAVGRHAKAEKKSTVMAESDDDDAVNDNDDDDFDEYLDWRAKKGVVKHK